MSRPLPHIPEQFAKLAALAERSTFGPERDTARRKAEALLTPEVGGYDRACRILAYQNTIAKAGTMNFMAGFDEFVEIDQPGHMAAEAEKRAEKLRRWYERRAALVERYGSLEAVEAPCERERLILASVEPWRVPSEPPHQRWTWELKGWPSPHWFKDMPADLRAAIEGACPMPATFADARAELDYWHERREDLEHAMGANGSFEGDSGLDLVAEARMQIVRELVEHAMPLRSAAEIAARMRAYRWNEMGTDTDVEDALLRDLDALAARETDGAPMEPAPATTIRPGTGGRISDALSADPSRSDRHVARALGCSPTTVGRMRGQMGLAGVRRSVRRGGQIYSMGGRTVPAGERA